MGVGIQLAVFFAALGVASANADAAPEVPEDLGALLQPLLAESKLPSLAAAVVVGDELRGIGAVGVRKLGDRAPVTVADKYHLGSCTKPMTATLAAILIEDGLLGWDTTVGEVLGKKIRELHADFEGVTLEQLLAHVGGLPGHAPRRPWAEAWTNQGKMRATEQRLEFVEALLVEKPAYPPGTKAEYSNQGYAVAGVMLETLAKQPWEDLMRERVFKPLGMTSAGFRAPEGEQPWGHRLAIPTRSDNPDAIGPAGTVHASVGDWSKFARFHLSRKPGTLLKNKESFDKLHATLPNSGQHAIGGWLAGDDPALGGDFIEMNGSNTMWFARLSIFPARDTAIVVTTNSAPRSAFRTCDGVVAKLLESIPRAEGPE